MWRTAWMAAGVSMALCAGCETMKPMEVDAMREAARRGVAAGPADSDAAVILADALDREAKAAPEARKAILKGALEQAEQARRFTIRQESPLPEGWPQPSLPGLVRVKRFPAVRGAWVRAGEGANGQFMVLFRHIQAQQIPMTAPVVMEYAGSPAPGAGPLGPRAGMAFLYRGTSVGKPGPQDNVTVLDGQPLTVVSVGVTGAYTEGNFRKALGQLQEWLRGHPEWSADGPPRVLAYNSPFNLPWAKYSEVQLPIRPAR